MYSKCHSSVLVLGKCIEYKLNLFHLLRLRSSTKYKFCLRITQRPCLISMGTFQVLVVGSLPPWTRNPNCGCENSMGPGLNTLSPAPSHHWTKEQKLKQIILYCIVLHCILLYSIVFYCILLYSIVFFC